MKTTWPLPTQTFP